MLPTRPPAIGLPTLWQAVEATYSALIITDALQPENPIVYSNQAFSDLTGYSREEVIGRNCRFLQGEDTDPEAVNSLRSAIGNRQHVRLTIKNYRKDGQFFWNDLVVSPVFNAKGELTNFVGMQLDITDRVSFEERLRQSRHELENSNKELEQFNYAASHDLQEPLRMVTSYLQLIKERYSGKLDEDGETFIGFASEGAQRMQSLVNDLLTLSRVRTTARAHKMEDLNAILDDVLLNLQTSIQESGARISSDKLPMMMVDRTQISQLFQNLISNAIKYCRPTESPNIQISFESKRQHVRFFVKDNGIGIEPQYHERIFGVFQRLHTRGEYPGTGVGLAICNKIVERHGGKLTLESEPGAGSTFIFTLPNKRA